MTIRSMQPGNYFHDGREASSEAIEEKKKIIFFFTKTAAASLLPFTNSENLLFPHKYDSYKLLCIVFFCLTRMQHSIFTANQIPKPTLLALPFNAAL